MEISRARDRAELVTDVSTALREQLEAVTGQRISSLEGIGDRVRVAPGKLCGSQEATRQRRQLATERSRTGGQGLGAT